MNRYSFKLMILAGLMLMAISRIGISLSQKQPWVELKPGQVWVQDTGNGNPFRPTVSTNTIISVSNGYVLFQCQYDGATFPLSFSRHSFLWSAKQIK